MNIILLSDDDEQPDGSFLLADNRAVHVLTILKSSRGERLEVGLIKKGIGTARIHEISDKKIILTDLQLAKVTAPSPMIDIICALPRPQTVKKILFTSAMMKVRKIFFIRANRVEKSYFHSPLLQPENLLKHLLEGMQQGKNIYLPELFIYDRFKTFFEDQLLSLYSDWNESPQYLLPEQTSKASLETVVSDKDNHLLFAIGPEGGWVDFELALMEKTGFKPFKLGGWTLRVEHALTACLAQTSLLQKNLS